MRRDHEFMTGPDFLRSVADSEAALGNHRNASIYRERADDWQNDLDALEAAGQEPPSFTPERRTTGTYIPAAKRRHAITPTDRH